MKGREYARVTIFTSSLPRGAAPESKYSRLDRSYFSTAGEIHINEMRRFPNRSKFTRVARKHDEDWRDDKPKGNLVLFDICTELDGLEAGLDYDGAGDGQRQIKDVCYPIDVVER